MLLRDVRPSDLDVYLRMRCDPVMMAELGGPLPREGMADKVLRDVRQAVEDSAWIKMIIPDESAPETVAGSVVLWSHEEDGEQISEVGWMVLPRFQGRGLGRRATWALLDSARQARRWGRRCTPSRRPRTGPRTVSAGPSGSAWSSSGTSRSPTGCSAPTTG